MAAGTPGEVLRREVKDSVFTDLFSDPAYLLELYRALHPEDEGATTDDLANVTIENALTNQLYNDLGFTVRGRAIVLLEAQSRWSANILPRCLFYAAETYKRWFAQTGQSLYATRPADMPLPEFYVVCLDPRAPAGDVLLSDAFFGGRRAGLEIRARVIIPDGGGDIIQQYLAFSRRMTDGVRERGATRGTLEGVIRECIEEGILVEYLGSKKAEVMDMMTFLFDQEYILDTYVAQEVREGRAEGRQGERDVLAALFDGLAPQGRYDDYAAALHDEARREELCRELGVGSPAAA